VIVLLEQIERRVTKTPGPTALKAKVALMQAVLRLQERQCNAHRDWVRLHPLAQGQEEWPQLQLAKGGRYPYPGLANVGNTCYLGAVLQCLLHCGHVRRHLSSMLSDGQTEGTRAFRDELVRLFAECYLGSSIDGSCKLAKFDVLSPHAFVDAFLHVRVLSSQALPLGDIHDACSAMEEIIAQIELGQALFVYIPEFDEKNPVRTFIDDESCLIDMNDLVRVALSKQAYVFSAAADFLAVRVPQFALSGDGSRFWLATVYKAKWSDEDLVHSGHFLQRNGARYRLVSYVEYVGATQVDPTPIFDSGHFVAYFREKDIWYKADDSVVTVVKPSYAKAFPYLCIFERVGHSVAEPWQPNPVTASESDEPRAPKRRRLPV
jgi:hypothetical protein